MSRPRELLVHGHSFRVDEEALPARHRDFWRRVVAGRWEPAVFRVLDEHLAPESVFLDVGSWVGPFALYAAALGAQVVALEPDPVAYGFLERNVRLNPDLAQRMNIIPFCLAERDGPVTIGSLRGFGESTSGTAFSSFSLQVTGRTLPSLLRGLGINQVGLLKIDIEGGEEALVPALEEYFRSEQPALFLEIHPFFFNDPVMGVHAICDALKCYSRARDVELDAELSSDTLREHLLGRLRVVTRLLFVAKH